MEPPPHGRTHPDVPGQPQPPLPVPALPPQPYPVPMPAGYPPYGTAPRPPYSGLAIASLVLGIVCCLAPVGLVLGATALVRIRRKGQNGRGMAVAGTVLSLVGTLLIGLAFGSGAAGEA